MGILSAGDAFNLANKIDFVEPSFSRWTCYCLSADVQSLNILQQLGLLTFYAVCYSLVDKWDSEYCIKYSVNIKLHWNKCVSERIDEASLISLCEIILFYSLFYFEKIVYIYIIIIQCKTNLNNVQLLKNNRTEHGKQTCQQCPKIKFNSIQYPLSQLNRPSSITVIGPMVRHVM